MPRLPLRPPLLAALGVLAMAVACAPAAPRFPGAPVLLISIDTLRADHLPAYGYRGVATPAIDRLRRDATLYRNAYSTCPLTLPSHVALLTGLPPYENGVRDNIGYRFDAARIASLPSVLHQAGYATGAAVSAYVLARGTGLAAAFDDYDDRIEVRPGMSLGRLERPGARTVASAVEWIDRHRDRPFLYFLHLYEPHAPYEPPEPFRSRYASAPYDGEIATADAAVGELLDHLRTTGLYDRAVIVLLSDHGEGLGDHGEKEHGVLLYRETVRVPLLVKLPGEAGAGSTVDSPVSLLDVFPTVLDLLGLRAPSPLAGLPLRVAARSPARRLYSETFYPRLHLGWSALRSLSGEHHRYIEGPDPELYDLDRDPGERANVLTRERRAAGDFQRALASLPENLAAPQAVSDEERRKLAALGYLVQPAATPQGSLLDPKRGLPDLAHLSHAYDLAASGQYAAAVALLQPLVERYPSMLDARFQLASNLAALGRDDEALAEYDRAIQAAPVAAPGMLIEKARIELRHARLDRAEADARAALAGQPEEAHEILARIAWQRGEVDQALQEGNRAAASDALPRAEVVLLLAQIAAHQGRFADVLSTLAPLEARIASGELPPQQGLDFLRGDALARLGHNADAESAFRDEIARFPTDAQAYASLAFLLASLHRFAEIDPLIEAMVRANPTRATMLTAAATVERLGDQAGARRWRERAARAR